MPRSGFPDEGHFKGLAQTGPFVAPEPTAVAVPVISQRLPLPAGSMKAAVAVHWLGLLIHLRTLMVLVPPPPVKALSTKMSPSVWMAGSPFPSTKVHFGPTETSFWKNQKPMLASPLLVGLSPPKTSTVWPVLPATTLSLYLAA